MTTKMTQLIYLWKLFVVKHPWWKFKGQATNSHNIDFNCLKDVKMIVEHIWIQNIIFDEERVFK